MSSSAPERAWEQGWDGHDQAQFLRFAHLPLPQKLEWLEQAQEIANHLSASHTENPTQPREKR